MRLRECYSMHMDGLLESSDFLEYAVSDHCSMRSTRKSQSNPGRRYCNLGFQAPAPSQRRISYIYSEASHYHQKRHVSHGTGAFEVGDVDKLGDRTNALVTHCLGPTFWYMQPAPLEACSERSPRYKNFGGTAALN